MSFMTRTVPDLPLPETDSVIRENTVVTVPIDAASEMNCAGPLSGAKAVATEAPAVAVRPGYRPAPRPIRTPLIPGTGPTGSLTSSLCFGILPVPADVRRA